VSPIGNDDEFEKFKKHLEKCVKANKVKNKEVEEMEKSLQDYENEIIEVIENNAYYNIEIWNDSNAYRMLFKKSGEKYLDIYLDEEYTEKYTVEKDIEINAILKAHRDIDTLRINSFSYKLPTKLSYFFNEIIHIKSLSIQSYFKADECKYIEELLNLESLKLYMWNAADIDFSNLKNLKYCTVLMSKYQSSKEEINASKGYIAKLEKEEKTINFELIID